MLNVVHAALGVVCMICLYACMQLTLLYACVPILNAMHAALAVLCMVCLYVCMTLTLLHAWCVLMCACNSLCCVCMQSMLSHACSSCMIYLYMRMQLTLLGVHAFRSQCRACSPRCWVHELPLRVQSLAMGVRCFPLHLQHAGMHLEPTLSW